VAFRNKEFDNLTLSEAGLYFFVRALFNERCRPGHLPSTQDDPEIEYHTWLAEAPEAIKTVKIWRGWGHKGRGKITPMDVKDKVCIDELFFWNHYQEIRIKKVK